MTNYYLYDTERDQCSSSIYFVVSLLRETVSGNLEKDMLEQI